MTKIKQSDFVGDTIEKVELPKVKTRAKRLDEWRKQNEAAYKSALMACCNCAPSRAQLLLVDQYEGVGPSDL